MATKVPTDKYHAVWIIFFTLGLGSLLPWNFFMTATEYFTIRLNDVDAANGTTAVGDAPNVLASIFPNAMTLSAMGPQLIFTCLNSFIHQRIPQKLRISGSLTVVLVVFLFTAVLVKVEMAPLSFFCLTIVKIICINSFGAVFQGSLFGLAGLLPASYTMPIMTGHGLAGIFAAFSMICAMASGSDMQDSAFGYFITACVVMLLAIFSCLALPHIEFFQYYMESNRPRKSTDEENKQDLPKKAKQRPEDNPVVVVNLNEEEDKQLVAVSLTADKDDKPVVVGSQNEEEDKPVVVVSQTEEENKPVVSVLSIFKQIWVIAMCVCFIFTVTVATFPAITVGAKSTVANEGWNKYFIPVSCFLLFNVMDTIGRSLTAVCMWPGEDSIWLPILVGLRVVFVPLFMLCNVQPRNYMPVWFGHDFWYILFMIVFSFSNGYLASLCMCFGPKKVAQHEAETTGAIMVFFVALGLALGAALSFPLKAMI